MFTDFSTIKQPVDWAINWYYYNILWIGVAMFGGAARYLDGYVKGKNTPSFLKLVANVIVSGFSGYMAAHVVIQVSFEWALVASGIGGYLGTQVIDWVATVMQEKFGGNWNTKIAERGERPKKSEEDLSE